MFKRDYIRSALLQAQFNFEIMKLDKKEGFSKEIENILFDFLLASAIGYYSDVEENEQKENRAKLLEISGVEKIVEINKISLKKLFDKNAKLYNTPIKGAINGLVMEMNSFLTDHRSKELVYQRLIVNSLLNQVNGFLPKDSQITTIPIDDVYQTISVGERVTGPFVLSCFQAGKLLVEMSLVADSIKMCSKL